MYWNAWIFFEWKFNEFFTVKSGLRRQVISPLLNTWGNDCHQKECFEDNNTIEGGCSADAWRDPKPKGEFFQGERLPGEVPVGGYDIAR